MDSWDQRGLVESMSGSNGTKDAFRGAVNLEVPAGLREAKRQKSDSIGRGVERARSIALKAELDEQVG